MTNPTAVRCGIILSATAAMSCSTGQYVYAYPGSNRLSRGLGSVFDAHRYPELSPLPQQTDGYLCRLLHKGTGRTRGAYSAPTRLA